MPRRLILPRAARRDLAEVRRKLRHPAAGQPAARKLRAIEAAIADLTAAPCRWPRSQNHQGHRKRVVGEYVILYEVAPDTGDNATAGDVLVKAVIIPGEGRTA